MWDTSEDYGRAWLDMAGGEDGDRIPNFIIDRARAYCARWEDHIKKATFLQEFMRIQFAADEMLRPMSYYTS